MSEPTQDPGKRVEELCALLRDAARWIEDGRVGVYGWDYGESNDVNRQTLTLHVKMAVRNEKEVTPAVR